MSGFIGRKEYLDLMEEVCNDSKYRSCAVIGRRRIGKTSLIREFIKNRDSVYIQFISGSAEMNLIHLSMVMSGVTGREITYSNMLEFLRDLSAIAAKRDTVIVFDEFPYAVSADPSFPSAVQDFIDNRIGNSFLILSGSSVGMMESETGDYGRPLYGRVRRIYLGEMSFRESKLFHPDMSEADQIRLYLTVGGVPYYMDGTPAASYRDYVERYILRSNSPFRYEADNVVNMELSPHDDYAAILDAIGSGRTEVRTISDITRIERTVCSKRLSVLEGLGFVSARIPMAGAPEKPVRYHIRDRMLAFHFCVIRRGLLSDADPGRWFDVLYPAIQTHHGRMFEDFCGAFISEHYTVRRIGSWWGSTALKDDYGRPVRGTDGKVLTEKTDIDVVAEIADGKNLIELFAECKFRNEACGMGALTELEARTDLVHNKGNYRLMMISRSGFTQDLREYAEDNGILLIDMDVLSGRSSPPVL